MTYLLDTNVVCETIKTNPDSNVISWLDNIPNHALYLSVITLGEIRKGIEKLDADKKRENLHAWLVFDLPHWFDTRILDIDIRVIDRWGRLQAETKRTLPAIDSLIAATALHYDLTLVTRNEKDFTHCNGLTLVNPWDA